MGTVLIRDGNGKTFNEVNAPAVVFDGACGTVYKVGEYEIMKDYYEETVRVYDYHGLYNMSKEMVLLELPKDQDIVDKIFQNTGYVKTYYQAMLETMEERK